MRFWRDYWDAPVHEASAWWLQKSLLGLLAFDLWLVMPSHAGRYGAGELNVAHFGWLDVIQPLPSPGLYIGLLLMLGVVAFALALGAAPRWVRGALFVGYTWSWSMSMLDSYQHHYLLSLLLFSFVCTRSNTSEDLRERGGTANKMPDAAHVMMATTCAIVYGYTAITKLSPDWRSGDALRRLAGRNEAISELRDTLGMEPEDFWPMLAGLTIALQILCCVAFLVAGQRGRFTSRKASVMISMLGLAPLAFHLGAEALGLQMGWFSYYMIAMTMALFIPPSWLHRSAIWFSPVAKFWRELQEEGQRGFIALLIVTGLSLIYFGHEVDLPGSETAMIALAATTATVGGICIARGTTQKWWPLVVSLLLGGLLMWMSIGGSTVRFDYYRFVGGDMQRRGQLERALEAYVRANHYAPRNCEALNDMDRPPERRRCDRQREEDVVRRALAGSRRRSP